VNTQATICFPRNPTSATVHVRPKQVFTISEMRTRADNWLKSSTQWHYPVMDPRRQEFDCQRYSRDQAISSFLQRHSPAQWNTVEIDAPTFDALESEYKALALNNTPRA
jgi:hypothetical protein